MKAEYEKIAPDLGSSFKLIQWKSKNDRFFWHSHPEHEIIYVKKGSGKLHIGNYLGEYNEGEILVLGANLPHSGLGYGLLDEHEEVIVQLKEDFLGNGFLDVPELNPVKRLFSRASLGIAFSGKIADEVAPKIEDLNLQTGLERLINLLDILKILSQAQDYKILNNRDVKYDFRIEDERRIKKIYAFVEENYGRQIDIKEMAEIANLTVPSFCRYFKKMTHYTFTDFLNDFRINNACKELESDKNISEICFDSGFNNISHFNKTFKQIKLKSPKAYRQELRTKIIF
jgi:AraC-like DNA-binding protein